MKAILIDDEKPALLQLQRLLVSDGRVTVSEGFTSVKEGLNYLSRERTDVVFLDIGMPEMNGLEAAEYIQQINPRARIVYVTAYSEYALEAFELYALDYVLKPVMPARLAKTLDRIEKLNTPGEQISNHRETPPYFIQLFRRMVLPDTQAEGKKLKLRTAKAQELLAYLLNLKAEWVSKDLILEIVWNGYPIDKAATHLHTAVYQIRKLLRDWGAAAEVEYAHENYRLKPGRIVTDVEQFEQVLQEQAKAGGLRRWELAEQALSIYRGGYLEDHEYDWAKPRRESLAKKYKDLTLELVRYGIDSGQARQAVKRLLIVAEKDSYSDSISRLLIEAYGSLGEYKELRRHYEQFERLLYEELGAVPEEETRYCYEQWMRRQGH